MSAVNEALIRDVVTEVLGRLGEGVDISRIRVDVGASGDFCYHIS